MKAGIERNAHADGCQRGVMPERDASLAFRARLEQA